MARSRYEPPHPRPAPTPTALPPRRNFVPLTVENDPLRYEVRLGREHSTELRPVPGTRQEVLDLFAPIRADIAELCTDYSDDDLRLVAAFLDSLGGAMDTAAARMRA